MYTNFDLVSFLSGCFITYFTVKIWVESAMAKQAFDEAQENFDVWRVYNQGVCVAFSTEGKSLLWDEILALKKFLEINPFIDGTDYLEDRFRLLNELPPKRGNKMNHPKPPNRKSNSVGAFCLCTATHSKVGQQRVLLPLYFCVRIAPTYVKRKCRS